MKIFKSHSTGNLCEKHVNQLGVEPRTLPIAYEIMMVNGSNFLPS